MSGHWIGRSGSRTRRRGTVGRYPPVAWPFSPCRFPIGRPRQNCSAGRFFSREKIEARCSKTGRVGSGLWIIDRPPPGWTNCVVGPRGVYRLDLTRNQGSGFFFFFFFLSSVLPLSTLSIGKGGRGFEIERNINFCVERCVSNHTNVGFDFYCFANL